MITLITGRPGHGKSLYTVEYMLQQIEKGRHVISINFNGLKINTEERDDLENWQNYPQGALVVVDEMQDYAKTRQKGDAKEWITAFSTHRHKGLDFIFVTQHPALLDVWVRRLVETHFHLERSPTKGEFSTLYRSEKVLDVSDTRSFHAPGVEKSTFKFPKEVYELYHSSDQHTVKKRIPKGLVKAAVAGVVIIGVITFGVSTIYDLFTKDADDFAGRTTANNQLQTDENPFEPNYQIPKKIKIEQQYFTQPENYIAEVNLPWSAPIYSDHLKVRTVPRITACYDTGQDCKCITQQGTRAHVTLNFCKGFIRDGMFDFQKEPQRQRIQSHQQQQILSRIKPDEL